MGEGEFLSCLCGTLQRSHMLCGQRKGKRKWSKKLQVDGGAILDEEVLIEKILEQRTERAEPCRNKPDSDTGRRDSTCKGPEAAVCLLGSRKAQETSGSGTL